MSFTCSADYQKIQRYEWKHDNLSLPDDRRYTLKNRGQKLEISQTKLEDHGDYRCVATTKGKVLGRSQNAALNVKGTRHIMLLSGNSGCSFFRFWAIRSFVGSITSRCAGKEPAAEIEPSSFVTF